MTFFINPAVSFVVSEKSQSRRKLGNAIYGGRVLFAVRKVVMHSPPLR